MPILLLLPALFIPGTMNIFLFQLAALAMMEAVIPYGIFVIAALIWSRNRQNTEIGKAIWLTPPVFSLLYFVFSLIRPNELMSSAGSEILSIVFLSLIAIAYGYFCVLFCLAVSLVIKTPALIRKWPGHK
ncbi:hypothetical protein [Granulosicoccus antarcticus]|uniref:Uncharacterized protein n=1 Tax=Granulosicoccus antarcticus IMCC3135 TaxID=1192854 RepID=A0A2Z2NPC1_9GAMM|nr:hypothetical protein [Granulosicoccus antarcticus]ASJ73286.1 hypothetical protein IMCC3135_16020 [Granulosicoccus antarcticus IMCC3135]